MRVFLDENYVPPVCCKCGKPDKRSRVKIHKDSLHFFYSDMFAPSVNWGTLPERHEAMP